MTPTTLEIAGVPPDVELMDLIVPRAGGKIKWFSAHLSERPLFL